jgi:hypothetical protein
MKGIEALLAATPGLTAAARADEAGNVLEMVGQMDAESLCSVAMMSRAPLEQASNLLGLGALRDWSFTFGENALFVHHDPESLVAVMGQGIKNPEAALKKLVTLLGETRGGQ